MVDTQSIFNVGGRVSAPVHSIPIVTSKDGGGDPFSCPSSVNYKMTGVITQYEISLLSKLLVIKDNYLE